VTVEEWIERYRRSWEDAGVAAIADLYTEDATYRSQIFREPYVGRDAIRAYWERGAAQQRDVRVRTGRPFRDGDRVAVEWWTTMDDPDDGRVTLPGCLLLRFAADGRCAALREYWAIEPGWHEPPADWGT
jgi:ketosteroid isomerase-like protein